MDERRMAEKKCQIRSGTSPTFTHTYTHTCG